jgi:hypothetical protein
MADNFDLKKFLTESKALENLNPVIAKENLSENSLRNRIREMIIAELEGGEDYELEDRKSMYGIDPELEDEDYSDYFFDIDTPEEELEEAKKKKKDEEVEDVESEDISLEDIPTTDEMPTDDMPAEDTSTESGLENVAANLEGTESEVMDHLMNALKIAKGMNNEKLTTQIGNTLKFFVSEYIGVEQ